MKNFKKIQLENCLFCFRQFKDFTGCIHSTWFYSRFERLLIFENERLSVQDKSREKVR